MCVRVENKKKLRAWRNLVVLILVQCELLLQTLEGVEQLPHLALLDARYNQIPSLSCAVVPLCQCPRLERLYIQHQRTSKPDGGPGPVGNDGVANGTGSSRWASRPAKVGMRA